MDGRPNANPGKIRQGFWPGLILPLIMFMILYLVRYKDVGFFDYLKSLWMFQMLMKLLSLCVVPNILLFLYFFKRRQDMAARGVIMATFIYAFLVLISSLI